jgi:hypothetical protein
LVYHEIANKFQITSTKVWQTPRSGKHQGLASTKNQAPNNKQGPNGKTTRTKPKKQPNPKQTDWSFCVRGLCLVLGVCVFGSCLFLGWSVPARSPRLELAVLPFGPCLLFGACYLELLGYLEIVSRRKGHPNGPT